MLGDLTYNVAVVDDDADLYEDYIEIIENLLKDQGYILGERKRYEELNSLKEASFSKIDLFLVDLKFGAEDKGQEFVKQIRENELTDILFYSSDGEQIRKYREESNFQNIYYAIRDENSQQVEYAIERLIFKMIKRANSPLSTRGIVLGCVAELDNLIKEKVDLLLGRMTENELSKAITECWRIYYNSYKSSIKKKKDFFGVDFCGKFMVWNEAKKEVSDIDISGMIRNLAVTDSSKNLHVLRKMYEITNGKDVICDWLQQAEDLLKYRNILAHVEQKLVEGVYCFESPGNGEILRLTENMCIEMRKSIIQICGAINAMI